MSNDESASVGRLQHALWLWTVTIKACCVLCHCHVVEVEVSLIPFLFIRHAYKKQNSDQKLRIACAVPP